MKKYTVEHIFDLKGKTAIITGASKGIGRDIALLLVNNGVNVALIARNQHDLQSIAEDIENLGGKVLPISYDLNKIETLSTLAQKVYKEFGSIDILVNNAGVNVPKSIEDTTSEDWDRVINLNMKSTFFMTQAVGKYMKKQQAGKIINVSSQMAFIGYRNRSVYSASKGGVNQLTKALAIEWASDNINVNAIAPTFTETEMTKEMLEDNDLKKELINQIPLGRVAKTDDLFGALLYLASGAANMVTGQTILVDGGWTVQ